MIDTQQRRPEDRWGPAGAVFYRWIIPAGLIGLIVLLLPVIWAVNFALFLAYPFLVAGVAYCAFRNVVLANGQARWLAAVGGLVLTATAAILAFGFWLGSGGI